MKRLLTVLLLAALLLTACANPNPPIDDATTTALTGEESTTPADNDTTLPDDTDTTVPDDTDTTVPDDTDTTVPDDTDTTVPDDTDTTVPDDPNNPEPPPVELAQRVPSVEILNTNEEVVTITLGMSESECGTLLPLEKKSYTWHKEHSSYIYCFNTQNQEVVMVFNSDKNVSEILVFPERITAPTDDDFRKLEVGMTLEEVIFTVGIPKVIYLNLFAIYYETDSGYMYAIGFEHSENGDILKDYYEYPPEEPSVDEVQSIEVLNYDGERMTISVGMGGRVVEEAVPTMFDFYHLLFVKNTENQVALIDIIDMDNQIKHIWLLPDITTPADSVFYELEYGMTFLEVVSLVGVPKNYSPSVYWVYFVSDSGTRYGAQFDRTFDCETELRIISLAIWCDDGNMIRIFYRQ